MVARKFLVSFHDSDFDVDYDTDDGLEVSLSLNPLSTVLFALSKPLSLLFVSRSSNSKSSLSLRFPPRNKRFTSLSLSLQVFSSCTNLY